MHPLAHLPWTTRRGYAVVRVAGRVDGNDRKVWCPATTADGERLRVAWFLPSGKHASTVAKRDAISSSYGNLHELPERLLTKGRLVLVEIKDLDEYGVEGVLRPWDDKVAAPLVDEFEQLRAAAAAARTAEHDAARARHEAEAARRQARADRAATFTFEPGTDVLVRSHFGKSSRQASVIARTTPTHVTVLFNDDDRERSVPVERLTLAA